MKDFDFSTVSLRLPVRPPSVPKTETGTAEEAIAFKGRVPCDTRGNNIYMRCTVYRMVRITLSLIEDASIECIGSH